MQAQQYKCLG